MINFNNNECLFQILHFFAVLLMPVVKGSDILVSSKSCPDIFKYKERSGVWSGVLTVPFPKSGLPMNVQIHLTLNALLTNVSNIVKFN